MRREIRRAAITLAGVLWQLAGWLLFAGAIVVLTLIVLNSQ